MQNKNLKLGRKEIDTTVFSRRIVVSSTGLRMRHGWRAEPDYHWQRSLGRPPPAETVLSVPASGARAVHCTALYNTLHIINNNNNNILSASNHSPPSFTLTLLAMPGFWINIITKVFCYFHRNIANA